MEQPLRPSHVDRDPKSGLVVEMRNCVAAPRTKAPSALAAMRALEAGAIANPSEQRAVGHYWLRNPERAPTSAIREAILASHRDIAALPANPDEDLLLLGIGGSALGVQLAADALLPGRVGQGRLICLDNGDPQGIADKLATVAASRTRVVVVSKSGTTTETLSAMQAVRAHWRDHGRDFESDAIAVSQPDSPLFEQAKSWAARFPIWDFVGGRTSLTSPAGLVPLRCLGLDWEQLLAGAASADRFTSPERADNPALRLAEIWLAERQERGVQAIAVLAYRDRLMLLGRYLQQLVMESLGKGRDLDGHIVSEGLIVYGAKGSTDQHSIVQHLVEGRFDSLTHFVDALETQPVRDDNPKLTISDRHLCRLYGTRRALEKSQRPHVTFTIPRVDAQGLGALVAFFERCVGYYAALAHINAYDQPGVQSGKHAADEYEALMRRLPALLADEYETVETLARRCDADPSVVWRFVAQLEAKGCAERQKGEHPFTDLIRRIRSSDSQNPDWGLASNQ